jgi:hypothetical protein
MLIEAEKKRNRLAPDSPNGKDRASRRVSKGMSSHLLISHLPLAPMSSTSEAANNLHFFYLWLPAQPKILFVLATANEERVWEM